MYLPPPAHGKMTGKDLWNRNKTIGFDRENDTAYALAEAEVTSETPYSIRAHL